MAIFRFSKTVAAAILDFLNFKFLTVGSVTRIDYVTVPNFVEIGKPRPKYCDFSTFQPAAILDF